MVTNDPNCEAPLLTKDCEQTSRVANASPELLVARAGVEQGVATREQPLNNYHYLIMSKEYATSQQCLANSELLKTTK